MHGLINKSIQSFISDTYGTQAWQGIVQASGVATQLGPEGFEPMQLYDDAVTESVLTAAMRALRRSRDSLLEDLGTYLISNERLEPLRRLLRFGGVSFTDFLYSLEDLQGRTGLAVPDLELPDLWLDEEGAGQFRLTCRGSTPGFGAVLVGALRALADDYGALAVLERHDGDPHGVDEVVMIKVHDPAFHSGRRFNLAADAC